MNNYIDYNRKAARSKRSRYDQYGFDESFLPETSNTIDMEHARKCRTAARHAAKKSRVRPVFWTIAIDVLVAAFLLFIFSLYYFILPIDQSGDAVLLPKPSASASTAPAPAAKPSATKSGNAAAPSSKPSPGASAKPSGTPVQTAASDNSAWGAKFAGMFTAGNVEKTESAYKSANINVTVNKITKNGAVYYLADIYVRDLKYFRTAFAGGKFGRGMHDSTDTIAAESKAVIAINGDYCGTNAGPVVRNGVLYRNESYKDVFALYDDGTMKTFTAKDFSMDTEKTNGLYQVWTFGPMLLQDGQPMDKFDSSLNPANPRTAIGYFEPGHYCFVVVDGRQPGYSGGYTLKEMSQLFHDLGCKAAFNLDGGQSAEMAFMGKLLNQPYNGGRGTSDIVYIADQ